MINCFAILHKFNADYSRCLSFASDFMEGGSGISKHLKPKEISKSVQMMIYAYDGFVKLYSLNKQLFYYK